MSRALRNQGYEFYGISKERYAELKAVCQQYDERKRKIRRGLSAVSYEWQPRTGISDMTAQAAMENSVLIEKNRKIEESARMAGNGIPGLTSAIMESVTMGRGYRDLSINVPLSETDFYAYRRLFYAYLNSVWDCVQK